MTYVSKDKYWLEQGLQAMSTYLFLVLIATRFLSMVSHLNSI
jgi:hypothetical protein